jgi:hypothetical protein
MKYEKIEDWLDTLTGDTKELSLATWYDHVAKHNANNNYEPHSEDFHTLWANFQKANS